MAPIRAKRQDAVETIDELLDAAERLFAAEGVENVALTQIVAISGQKNRSALHYHFGSRGGVLSAVMDRRLEAINARRIALLEALPADAPAIDVVRANIAALALPVLQEPWGPDYVSILAQVRFHPQLLGESLVRDENLSGLRAARARLRAAAPHVSAAAISRRFLWLSDSVAFALARWLRDTPPERRTKAAIGPLIDDLASYGTAGLMA